MNSIENFNVGNPQIYVLWNLGKTEFMGFALPELDWSPIELWWSNLKSKLNRMKLTIANFKGESNE